MAYTIGVISPNSNSKKVMPMASNINPRNGALSKLNTEDVKFVNKRMAPTFTKLLPISIVANSLCGLLSKRRMFRSALFSDSSSSFNVCGSSEKKATSEAEITAEQANNNMLQMSEIIADIVIG